MTIPLSAMSPSLINCAGGRGLFHACILALAVAPLGFAADAPARRTIELRDAQPLEFIRIEAGSFLRGSPDTEADRDRDEGPQHEVRISRPFYLGVYEVTQGQWLAVMGYNPAVFKHGAEALRRPVESVSWNECQQFIQRLNDLGRGRFRLPTEAEWEYAARAGTTTRYHWGDDPGFRAAHDHAWTNSRSAGTTHAVGTKSPNPWGLYDVSGGVWEWCSDWYAPYRGEALEDPAGPAQGSDKVFRGGSWYDFPKSLRNANRHRHPVDRRYSAIGLRLVLEAAEPPVPRTPPDATPRPERSVVGPNGAYFRFVQVPAGVFRMGSPEDETGRARDEGPLHEVRFERPYWIGKYEVTQAQWRAVMGENPSAFREGDAADAQPVEMVTWPDTQAFVARLNQLGSGHFRLPTEAEWEYACRAGSAGRFPWGDDPNYRELGEHAWYNSRSEGRVHPVGRKRPNAWGLHDLHGNVWEWCQDEFALYPGAAGGPKPEARRIIRGGSWFNEPEALRSANRHRHPESSQLTNLGLRLVWEPLPSTAAAGSGGDSNDVMKSTVLVRVQEFCDRIIAVGRDDYGPKRLRIFPNTYDIAARSVPLPDPQQPWPRHTAGHAPFVTELQKQASLLRLLWGMTDLTGDPRYREAVREALTDYFAHCVHPETGAFPWGTHCGYDVVNDVVYTRGRRGLMEEKISDFPWEILYAVNPAATLRMIDHLRLSYDREMTTYFHHREMDQTTVRTPDPMFNTDAERGNHPYTLAGVTHMKAWAFAWTQTRDRKYLDWIGGTFAIHTKPLDPDVGLITEIPNLFRHRVWPDSDNEWERRSTMVKYGDPYLWGYYMFKVAEQLPEREGERLRASGLDQLRRWPRAAWDATAGTYWQNFPIYPAENASAVQKSVANNFTKPRHGKFWEIMPGVQGHHQMVTAYLAYANAYRRTGDEFFRRIADHVYETYVDDARFLESDGPEFALLLGIHLQATAELLERSGDETYRRRGRQAVERAWRDFFQDGFILGRRGTHWVSFTYGSDDLAVGLLRFDLADRGLRSPIEDAYLYDWGYSYP